MFEVCQEGIGGLKYNTGMCVREILDFYVKVDPNRATPEGMAVLVDELARIANAGEEKIQAEVAVRLNPTIEEQQILDAYQAFWDRVHFYRKALDAAPAGDRQAIQDDVSIPLLYGTEGPGGELRGADIRTPFQLANMVGVSVGFRDENFQRLVEDIKSGVTKAGLGIGTVIFAVIAVYAALLLLRK